MRTGRLAPVLLQCFQPGPSPNVHRALQQPKSSLSARNVDAALPYVCKVVVAPEKTNVRGVLELRDQNQVVLQNMELR
jgi:hypothetical protein